MSLTRREFIATTSVGLFSSYLSSFGNPVSRDENQSGYELLIFATDWGFKGSVDEFCKKIKEAGYNGAEVWYPTEEKNRTEMLAAFKKYNLKFGFLVGGSDAEFKTHFDQYISSLTKAINLKPEYINCHSGRDFYSSSENQAFIQVSLQLAKSFNVPVYHETHRSRILYAAPVAKEYIRTNEGLRITLDISHWCNVHESLLTDQKETVALTLDRTDHIHARIGHAEGPQVSDPRAPEWKPAVDAHFAWWDKVVERKKKEGKRISFLTEFGPPDYMPTMPTTRKPLADQWELNLHMLNTLRKRYS